jgi:hypothetical protein
VPYVINNTTLTYLMLCYTNLADQHSGSNPQISKVAQLSRVARPAGLHHHMCRME